MTFKSAPYILDMFIIDHGLLMSLLDQKGRIMIQIQVDYLVYLLILLLRFANLFCGYFNRNSAAS
jgi:hypothetical protein